MKLKNNTFVKYPFGKSDFLIKDMDGEVELNIKNTRTFFTIYIKDDTDIFCNIPNYFDAGSELFIIVINEVMDSKLYFTDGFKDINIDSRLDDDLFLSFVYDGINFNSFSSSDVVKNKYQKYLNRKSITPYFNSVVDSGTNISLTDSTANFTINQYVDKICKIHKLGDDDDFEFAIISGNTETTLYFDDELLFIPCSSCIYNIIDTIVITEEDLNNIIALNIYENDIGIILPKITPSIERKYITAYIERGNGGDYFAPLLGRGTDYQAGVKYGTLQYRGEGVTLYAHTWNADVDDDVVTPHWDIINLQGIQRSATGYWNGNESITSTTYIPIGSELLLEIDRTRRFLPVIRSGIKYLRYQSLIPRLFMINWSPTIFKTGSSGEAEIIIGIRNQDSGIINIIETRSAKTQFGGGEGYENISLRVPYELRRNDEVVFMAKRTAGVIVINSGSTIDITEI